MVVIRNLSENIDDRDLNSPFRLPVDRSFSVKGFGTVITGTVTSGTVNKEESLIHFPSKKEVRVDQV